MKNWNEIFKELTLMIASWNRDDSTKVGAVIVDDDNTLLSTGYNGLPKGCEYKPERLERPLKYSYFEHAEINAINNAAKNGVSTKNSIMYVTFFPCCDCARGIINSGIKKVISPEPDWNHERWG